MFFFLYIFEIGFYSRLNHNTSKYRCILKFGTNIFLFVNTIRDDITFISSRQTSVVVYERRAREVISEISDLEKRDRT